MRPVGGLFTGEAHAARGETERALDTVISEGGAIIPALLGLLVMLLLAAIGVPIAFGMIVAVGWRKVGEFDVARVFDAAWPISLSSPSSSLPTSRWWPCRCSC